MVTAYTFKNQPVVQEDWVEPDQPAVLDAGITAIDSVIHLRAGTGSVLPSPTGGRVATAIIDKEIIAFTDNTGDVLTGVTRGFGGTQQAAHGAGRQVRNIIPAEFLNQAVLTDDPRLADARLPVTHGSSHYSGASDALALLNLAGNLTQTRSHDSADTDDPTGIHHTIGSGAGNVVAGSDTRLNDARAPLAHASTHNTGGGDALAVDSAANTGSLRTLGAGALQAAPGDHAFWMHPDVGIGYVDDNQLLRYDAATNRWVNTYFNYFIGSSNVRPAPGIQGRLWIDGTHIWLDQVTDWTDIATRERESHLNLLRDVWVETSNPDPGDIPILTVGQVLRWTDTDGFLSWRNYQLPHADLADAGTNTHAQLDTHLGDTTIHHTLGTGAAQAAAGNDVRFTDARTPTAHATTHNAGGADALAADAVAGTASLRSLGTASTQAVAGNDARLSDARTPVSHAVSHNAGGADALAIDAVAGTGSLRTLGTGATQAAAGNDARFTDARTPTAHAASHNAGGTDVLAIDSVAATGSLRTLGIGAQQAAAGSHTHTTFAGLTLTSPLLLPDGTLTAPALSFVNEVGSGIYRSGVGDYVFLTNGASVLRVQGGNGIATASDLSIAWGSSGTSARDLFMYRDAAGALALRNGVNAQSHRVYNTFTDTLNYERAIFGWQQTTNALTIGTVQAGTGVARPLYLMTGGVNRWQVDANGHILAATDNAYDIGASGATRPRNVYTSGAVLTGNGSATAVAHGFGAFTNDGLFSNGTNGWWILSSAGVPRWGIRGSHFVGASDSSLSWCDTIGTSGGAGTGNRDTVVSRDSVGTLALANGTASGTSWLIYNTFTDGLNYERGRIGWVGNSFSMLVGQAGTGLQRPMLIGTTGATPVIFETNNTQRWQIDSSGNLQAVTDAAYTIGLNGSNRPSTLFIANADFTYGLQLASTTVNSVISPNLVFQDNQTGGSKRMHIRKGGDQTLAVVDTAGGNALAIIAVASAVNSLQTTSAATGNSPILSPAGSDTNIGLALNTKGTGVVTTNSTIRTADGTAALPAHSFTSDATLGHYKSAANNVGLSIGGVLQHQWGNNGLVYILNDLARFNMGAGSDVQLAREAAGVIGLRNGASLTSPTEIRVYNTYTDSLNYERGRVGWSGNELFIGTQAAGTGTGGRRMHIGTGGAGHFFLQSNGGDRWIVGGEASTGTGHLLAVTDNAYDIGAVGANRPRNLNVAGNTRMGNQSTVPASRRLSIYSNVALNGGQDFMIGFHADPSLVDVNGNIPEYGIVLDTTNKVWMHRTTSSGLPIAWLQAGTEVMRLSVGGDLSLTSGKFILPRSAAAAVNPGANLGTLYFRDGTTVGTLKLVVRAGAAGAETTILDNIPQ